MRTFVVLIFLFFSTFAFGSESEKKTGLRYSLGTDLTVLTLGTLGWAGTAVFEDELAPDSCRWCDRDAPESDTLNTIDRRLRNTVHWTKEETAQTLSDITAYALTPLLGLGLIDHFGVNALVVMEAVVITASLTQLVKLSVARERPNVHFKTSRERNLETNADRILSFPSGHTSFAFSLAAASATVAFMQDYPSAPWILGLGLLSSSLTGYFRMAADKHYLTDVLAGAALGSFVGFSIPYFFHKPVADKSDPNRLRVSSIFTTDDGIGLRVQWLP